MRPTNDVVRSRWFAWLTLAVWVPFVFAALPGTIFRGQVDYVIVGWWVAAALGLLSAFFALRGRSSSIPLMLAAGVLLVAVSAIYWWGVIEQLIEHDQQKTVFTVISRVFRVTSLGIESAIRNGPLALTVATMYRELLMPLIQIAVLIIAATSWAISKRTRRAV